MTCWCNAFVLKTGTDKWKADLAGLFAANILKLDADALLKKAKDLDAKAPNSKVSAVDDITDTKKNKLDVAEDSSGGGLAKPKKVEDGNNKKLPPLESGLNSVDDIIKGVENGDLPLSNNIQKGNYGEMKMDAYFESQRYERISLDRVTDLNTPTHQEIDGVYYNPDGHPPYIIGEAKYGSSKLGNTLDGPQMSDDWIMEVIDFLML